MSQLWETMPQLRNGTTASGLTAKSDGMSCAVDGDFVVLYGGARADRIWVLDLGTMTWHEVRCTGTIPPARVNHSAVMYGGHMLVYGGELLDSASDSESAPYYELELETHEWVKVESVGENPGSRSHHTATVVEGRMIVIGGKRPGPAVTERELRSDRAAGFYDVHVLNILLQQWTRIERHDPVQPMIWGHSAVPFRHYVLLWGGFEMGLRGAGGEPVSTEDDAAAPLATLTDRVHVWNVAQGVWGRATPARGQASPAPRAMHCAVRYGAEMLVFGGVTMDDSGRALNVNDAWLWDVGGGGWGRLEFCVPYWPSKKLIHALHQNKLVVCADLTAAHVLDMGDKGRGWVKVSTDPAGLFRTLPVRPRPPSADSNPPTPPPDTPPPEPAEAEAEPEQALAPPGFALLPPQTGPLHLVLQPGHDPEAAERRRREAEEAAAAVAREEAAAAHRSQQQDTIRLLQQQVNGLSAQAAELTAMQLKLHTASAADAAQGSPSRPHLPSSDVQLLSEELMVMHRRQAAAHEDSRRRQDERFEGFMRAYEEEMEMLRQQQRQLRLAQEQMASAKAAVGAGQTQAEQLSLLREQQQSLLQLQRDAAAPGPAPPAAAPVVPDGVRSMAEQLARLGAVAGPTPPQSRASSRPPPPPAPAASRHWAPPAPDRVSVRSPSAQPPPLPPAPVATDPPLSLSRQAARKLQHIEHLKQRLQSMDADLLEVGDFESGASPSPVVPVGLGRASSSVSSSPSRHWGRLHDAIGAVDVARVTTPPRSSALPPEYRRA
eukprot:TRINITY_DN4729_c0_g1_i1.p1 TRINITY_DN4729_c0_g1~~TRINITY_DN4729_c0_g1_i1.p1  ORF type:complete len:775 (+),score=268.83 TRINITY_DN4729_c0_g1_i1:90-2414(+)